MKQEFGYGVGKVQQTAAPSNYQVQVIRQQPLSEQQRRTDISRGLQGLSQSLSRAAQRSSVQSGREENLRIEETQQYVNQRRAEGAEEAQIIKEVTDLGIAPTALVSQLEKAGSFTSNLVDAKFRFALSDGDAERHFRGLQADWQGLLPIAEKRLANMGIDENPEDVVSEVVALFEAAGKETSNSIADDLTRTTFNAQAEAELTTLISQVTRKAEQIRDVDFQNQTVLLGDSLIGSLIRGERYGHDYDSDHFSEGLSKLMRERGPMMTDAHKVNVMKSLAAAFEAEVDGSKLDPLDREDNEFILESLDAFEDGLDPAFLEAHPEALKDINILRAKYGRDEQAFLRAELDMRNVRMQLEQPPETLTGRIKVDRLVSGLAGELGFKTSNNKDLEGLLGVLTDVRSRIDEFGEVDMDLVRQYADKFDVSPDNLKTTVGQMIDKIRETQDSNGARARLQKQDEARAKLELKQASAEKQKAVEKKSERAKMLALRELQRASQRGEDAMVDAFQSMLIEGSDMTEADLEDVKHAYELLSENPAGWKALSGLGKSAVNQAVALIEARITAGNEDAKFTEGMSARATEMAQSVVDGVMADFMNDPTSSINVRLQQEPGAVANEFAAAIDKRMAPLLAKDALSDTPILPGSALGAPAAVGWSIMGARVDQETAYNLLPVWMDNAGLYNDDPNRRQRLTSQMMVGIKATNQVMGRSTIASLRNFAAAAAPQSKDYEKNRRLVFNKVPQLADAYQPLLDLVKGEDLGDQLAGRAGLDALIYDSGLVTLSSGYGPMEWASAMRAPYERVYNQSGNELELKTAKKMIDFFNELEEYTPSFVFSGEEDIMRLRLAEFQPDGRYGGLFDENTGLIQDKWKNKAGENRVSAFEFAKSVLQDYAGIKDPSESQIYRFIWSQSEVNR